MPKSVPINSRRMVSYIGIDPGQSGGLSIISELGGTGVESIAMPKTERDIWEWFDCSPSRCRACIEWIHPAIQKIGKSQMSKLYGSYMSLRMVLTGTEIPFEVIKAHEWQKGLGIPKRKKNENRTKWKNRLKAKAQQLFPQQNVTLATADSLLIAEFCRRKHEGTL